MSRLSREDWAQSALEAIAEGGVSAVSVERLATRLGATKGSFYWHFSAREQLIEAALDRWEQRSTLDVIAEVEAKGGTAEERLRRLFVRVFDPSTLTGADVSLLSHMDEPVIAAALERVTAARLRYITGLMRGCGLPAAAARRRAVFAYSAFIGHLHLKRSSPDLIRGAVGSVSRYADEVIETLLATVTPAKP